MLHPAPGRVVGYHWIGVGAHHFSADVIAAKDVSRLPGRPDWDCTGAASGVPGQGGAQPRPRLAPFTYPAGYGVELAPGDALLLYAILCPRRSARRRDTGSRSRRPSSRSAPRCPTAGARRLNSAARLGRRSPQCSLADAQRRQMRGDGVPDPAEH